MAKFFASSPKSCINRAAISDSPPSTLLYMYIYETAAEINCIIRGSMRSFL